jgi:hypothetical protein
MTEIPVPTDPLAVERRRILARIDELGPDTAKLCADLLVYQAARFLRASQNATRYAGLAYEPDHATQLHLHASAYQVVFQQLDAAATKIWNPAEDGAA